jgi:hypothetical protein
VVERTAVMLQGKKERGKVLISYHVHIIEGRNVPSDGGLDAIVLTSRLDDEPEEDVDHVDDPDGSIEVKSIPQHELPVADRLGLE